jgi:hypothetical protein
MCTAKLGPLLGGAYIIRELLTRRSLSSGRMVFKIRELLIITDGLNLLVGRHPLLFFLSSRRHLQPATYQSQQLREPAAMRASSDESLPPTRASSGESQQRREPAATRANSDESQQRREPAAMMHRAAFEPAQEPRHKRHSCFIDQGIQLGRLSHHTGHTRPQQL